MFKTKNHSIESKSRIDNKWDGKLRLKTNKINFVGANIKKVSRNNSLKAINNDLEFSMVYNSSRKNLEKKHETIVKSDKNKPVSLISN